MLLNTLASMLNDELMACSNITFLTIFLGMEKKLKLHTSVVPLCYRGYTYLSRQISCKFNSDVNKICL